MSRCLAASFLIAIVLLLIASLTLSSILQKETQRHHIDTKNSSMIPGMVAATEVVKFGFSAAFAIVGCACRRKRCRHLVVDESQTSTLKSFVACSLWLPPAVLYTVSNSILLRVLHYLDPGTQSLVNHVKILYTAWLLRFVLNRRLANLQWIAIVFLTIGIITTQLAHVGRTSPVADLSSQVEIDSVQRMVRAGGGAELSRNVPYSANGAPMYSVPYVTISSTKQDVDTYLGLVSSVETFMIKSLHVPIEYVGVALCCTGVFIVALGNVYCEWLYKRQASSSIHVQNIQLFAFSSVVAIVMMGSVEGKNIFELQGFNDRTIVSAVLISALAGVLVSLVIKKGDNMIFVFADVIATICLLVVSYVKYGLTFRPFQICGAILSLGSIVLYFLSSPTKTSSSTRHVESRDARIEEISKNRRGNNDRRALLQRHRFVDGIHVNERRRISSPSSPISWSVNSAMPWDIRDDVESDTKRQRKTSDVSSVLSKDLLDDMLRRGHFAVTEDIERDYLSDEGRENDDHTVCVRSPDLNSEDEYDNESDVSEVEPLLERFDENRGFRESKVSIAHGDVIDDGEEDQKFSSEGRPRLHSDMAWITSRAVGSRLCDVDLARLARTAVRDGVFPARYECTETPEEIMRRDALRSYYRAHNPKFVSSVEDVLMRHRGLEDVLIKRLEEKYGGPIPAVLVEAATAAVDTRQKRRDVSSETKTRSRIIVTSDRICFVRYISENGDGSDNELLLDFESDTDESANNGDVVMNDSRCVLLEKCDLLDLHEMKYPEQDHCLLTMYFKKHRADPVRTKGQTVRLRYTNCKIHRYTFYVPEAKKLMNLVANRVGELRRRKVSQSVLEGQPDHLHLSIDALRKKGTTLLNSLVQTATRTTKA